MFSWQKKELFHKICAKYCTCKTILECFPLHYWSSRTLLFVYYLILDIFIINVHLITKYWKHIILLVYSNKVAKSQALCAIFNFYRNQVYCNDYVSLLKFLYAQEFNSTWSSIYTGNFISNKLIGPRSPQFNACLISTFLYFCSFLQYGLQVRVYVMKTERGL